eukprot:13501158-Alexandrium_andersonii.AAC.1
MAALAKPRGPVPTPQIRSEGRGETPLGGQHVGRRAPVDGVVAVFGCERRARGNLGTRATSSLLVICPGFQCEGPPTQAGAGVQIKSHASIVAT